MAELEKESRNSTDLVSIVNSEEFRQKFQALPPAKRLNIYWDLKEALVLINSQRRDIALAGLSSLHELVDIVIENKNFYGSRNGEFRAIKLFRRGRSFDFSQEVNRLPKTLREKIADVSRHVQKYGGDSVAYLCDYEIFWLAQYGAIIVTPQQAGEERIVINTIQELRNFQERLLSGETIVRPYSGATQDWREKLLGRINEALAEWDAIPGEPPTQESR